jgi:TonB family protein
MKKTIMFFIALAIVFGCKEKSKIEIIPNYEVEYYSANSVDTFAEPLQQNNPQPISFAKYIKEIHKKDNSAENVYYPLSVRFFINEKGKIDKVKIINGKLNREVINMLEKNGKTDLSKGTEILKAALPDIEKLNFKPAVLNGKKVKVHADVEKIYYAKANGDVVIADSEIRFAKLKSDFEDKQQDDETFFVVVEDMPSPIGGIKVIQQNIVYPSKAKANGIEGRVYIKAYIDSTGKVVRTEVIKGIGYGCDEAAAKAVKQVNFVPGKQRGKNVNVQVVVPILFKLQ